MDGMIYMISAALGFAATENVGYMMGFGFSVGLLRAILSYLGHVSFSAILGYYLAKSKLEPRDNWLWIGFVLASAVSHAQTPTYDESTRYLTLPTVSVAGTTYSNVVIRVDTFAVISAGTSTPTPPAPTCSVSLATYNAISLDMTRAEVNQIVGCANDSGYTLTNESFTVLGWKDSYRTLFVYFDAATGNIVTSPTGSTDPASFKRAIGL